MQPVFGNATPLLAIVLVTTFAVGPRAAAAEEPPRVPFALGFGMKKFQGLCGECHGQWADGTDQGPPLIHPYYKPSHHSDESFYRAALQGVKAHHWRFGDMPPIAGATRKDIDRIIPFVRWLQKEKGVY